jgi:hypothetical protein
MEHIIAEKHGGKTEAENLTLACPYCNRAKGSDLGSINPETPRNQILRMIYSRYISRDRAAAIDPETGEMVCLFNPRKQKWQEH